MMLKGILNSSKVSTTILQPSRLCSFTCSGSKNLSCTADRSLIFCNVDITDTGFKTSRCHKQIASDGTVYDMTWDPATDVAVTVGQKVKKLIGPASKKVNFGVFLSYFKKKECMLRSKRQG